MSAIIIFEDEEYWMDIEGYEGLYQVSTFGRVKSLSRKRVRIDRILKVCTDRDGYYRVHLYKNKLRKSFLVSRLVGLAFLKKIEGKNTIDHIDRNKLNNHISNLRWADDFEQAINKDCVINAKHYSISFKNTRDRPSNWRISWVENGKGRSKYFLTEELARDYAKENLDGKVLEKSNSLRK